MFEIVFYVFSSLLAYLDYKRFIVPNIILLTLLLMLVVFGFIENRLNIYSILISLSILLFFSCIILINRKMVLGGGDIKYMMIIAIFLEPMLFPFFLVITGIVQSLFLVFAQVVQKKQKSAMVPAMFIAVIVSIQLQHSSLLPFGGMLSH